MDMLGLHVQGMRRSGGPINTDRQQYEWHERVQCDRRHGAEQTKCVAHDDNVRLITKRRRPMGENASCTMCIYAVHGVGEGGGHNRMVRHVRTPLYRPRGIISGFEINCVALCHLTSISTL